jgi:hypothetical protein
MAVFMSGCGQTYKLETITASPSTVDLTSASPTQALIITATFSNSKTSVVTLKSNYQVQMASKCTNLSSGTCTDPSLYLGNEQVLTVDPAGNVSAISGGCTTVEETVSSVKTAIPDPYPVVVTYTNDGVTAQTTVWVNVETTTNCTDLS